MFPCQVQRQYIGDLEVARIKGDAAATAESANDWESRARKWMQKRQVQDEAEGSRKTPKLERKKAYHWGVTLDQILEMLILLHILKQHHPVPARRVKSLSPDFPDFPTLNRRQFDTIDMRRDWTLHSDYEQQAKG